MKRYTFIVLLSLCATLTFAQEGTQGFGLHIGFAQPNLRLNSPAEEAEDKSKLSKTAFNGLKVGLFYEATYVKGFGSMIGLNYTYGGCSTAWTQKNELSIWPKTRNRSQLHALEIFVDWQYKFCIAKDTYILLYTGPTIQCNVAMSSTVFEKNSENGDPAKTTISCFDYDDADLQQDYKRLNVTWGIGAGFQYDRYFIRGGYDFGLINPYNFDNFEKIGMKDRNTRGRLDQWQVKFGVFLWKN